MDLNNNYGLRATTGGVATATAQTVWVKPEEELKNGAPVVLRDGKLYTGKTITASDAFFGILANLGWPNSGTDKITKNNGEKDKGYYVAVFENIKRTSFYTFVDVENGTPSVGVPIYIDRLKGCFTISQQTEGEDNLTTDLVFGGFVEGVAIVKDKL